MQRCVEPEILDRLPADDPAAVRSRRDLRRINFLMGNERWIARQVRRMPAEVRARGVVELGAGEGTLARRLRADGPPQGETICYDLAPRPACLPPEIGWRQADILRVEPPAAGVLVANLFLHHFEGEELAAIGRWCRGMAALAFCEPLRSRLALVQGGLLLPFVDPVTRHDMPVSIRAGFLPGELAAGLGLEPAKWRVREERTWRGGLRMLAWRI